MPNACMMAGGVTLRHVTCSISRTIKLCLTSANNYTCSGQVQLSTVIGSETEDPGGQHVTTLLVGALSLAVMSR
jgi:hypothetical protein